MRTNNKYLIIITIILSIILFAEAFFLFGLPKIVNIAAKETFVEKLFADKTDATLDIEKIKLKTYADFSVEISANKLDIYDKKNNTPIVQSKKPRVRISLFPLLIKHLSFKDIGANDLSLNLLRYKDKKWNIEKIIFKSDKKTLKIKAKKSRINLSNYDIKIDDKFYNKHFKINGEYFKIANFTMDKLIDVDTYGTITAPGVNTNYQLHIHSNLPLKNHLSDKDFTISGYINNIEPEYFSPYITKYLGSNTTQIKGKASLNIYTKRISKKEKGIVLESVWNNVFIKKNPVEYSISAPDKTIIKGKLDLRGKNAILKTFSLKTNNFSILAKGTINQYNSKKPKPDISITLPKSKLQDIAAFLPDNLLPGRSEIKKIKHYGIKGDVVANVTIKGKLPQPDITGVVTSHNLQILKDMDAFHRGDVKLTFDKRKLHTQANVYLTKTKEFVDVDGITHIYMDDKNHFKIISSPTVELKTTQKLLLPIQDVFMFQLGPVPEMKITKGKGRTALYISGTKYDGTVDGYVKFNNAETTYNGIYGIIKNATGEVLFNKKVISFQTKKAFIDNQFISIFGKAKMEKDVDFNIEAKNINADFLLRMLKHSTLLEEINDKLYFLEKARGNTKIKINIKAKLPKATPETYGKKISQEDLLKDMLVNGAITFDNANAMVKDFSMPIINIKGSITFTRDQVTIKGLNAKLHNSLFTINGKIITDLKSNIPDIDLTAQSSKVSLNDIAAMILSSKYASKIDNKSLNLAHIKGFSTLKCHYKAKSKVINLNDISLYMLFIPQKTQSSLMINAGSIELKHGNANFDNITGKLFGSPLKISGNIHSIFSEKPNYKLKVNASNVDIKILDYLTSHNKLPKKINFVLSQYTNYLGKVSLDADIANKSIKGNVALNNVQFVHKYSGVPILLNNASIKLNTNRIVIKPLTATIGTSPLYAELIISNILKNPSIDGYFTTKITNDFVDTYVNTKLSYPVKIKGDVTLSADLSGTIENLAVMPTLKLNEGADLSYLSSNLGDENVVRELRGNFYSSPTQLTIKKIDYLKYMTSQNNRTYPLNFATIKGTAIKHGEKYILDSLYVKTTNGLPARLLNFAFKKSLLKQGSFNCNMFYKMNHTTKIPKVFGSIDLRNIDIPLYDTLIKDVSIISTQDNITANVKGSAVNSDFSIKTNIVNRLSYPIKIKNLDIESKRFNYDELLNTMNKMSLENYQKKPSQQQGLPEFNLSNISIDSGSIKAGDITFKTLPAHNLSTKFSLKNSVFNLSDINFEIAGGTLTGTSEYDFNTTKIEAELTARGVDANSMATVFYDMKNQIYGKMNSQFYVYTKGTNQETRLKNLGGRVYFRISDGKMPKLGSLEYLLRAGNLIKSGLTGLTINNIVDIVNPIKTGTFSSINGSFTLSNGTIENLEIYSKGENLSIYLKGTYDIVNANADMKVLGRLSRKISTVLGPVGNASLNSFFKLIPGVILSEADRAKFLKDLSKIPGLEFSINDYRIFQAKIDGNINGDKYVSSFKWIE
ncbi:MAG: AsmA-like C-terminal region-containing protein [Candidatus Gastranaerophilales bacterium]|nr:AsmA-like C-terminal region-containing protein [Candidatus Gastranaerophilales bacterium]